MLKRFSQYFLKFEVLFFGIFYLFQRYGQIKDIFNPLGFAPPGVDPFYRFHRTHELILNKLSFVLHDPLLHFPTGDITPWMPGMEYLVATVLYFFGITDVKDVVMACILSVPLFGLPLILCVKPVVSKLTDNVWTRIFVYLGYIFMPSLILNTSLGRFDHHVFEAVLVLGMFCMYFAQMKSSWKIGFWTIFFVFSWFVWPHAWLLFVILVPLLIYDHNMQKVKELAFSMVGVFFLYLLMFWMLSPQAFIERELSFFSISWFVPLCALGFCVFCFDYYWVLLRISKNENRYKYVPILTIGAIICALLFSFSGVVDLLKRFLRVVIATEGTWSNTAETNNAFVYAFKFNFVRDSTHALFLPFVMAFLYWRKRARVLVIFTILPCIMYFFQIRFMSVLFPLSIILVMLFVFELPYLKGFSKYASSYVAKTAASALLILLMVFPIRNSLGHAYANNYPYYYYVKKASQFLKEESERLQIDTHQAGVAARWPFGHWIMLYSKLPAVATPFQGKPSMDMARFFYGRGEKYLTEFISEYPVRYLMMVNAPIEHMNQVLFFHPEQTDAVEVVNEQLVVKDGFMEMMISKFLYDNAVPYIWNPHGPWRVIFSPRQKIGKGSQYSDIKIFERVKGAMVLLENATDTKLSLYAEVKVDPEETIKMNLFPLKTDKGLMWKVPYGEYNASGVFFPGNYEVKNQEGDVLFKVHVTEKDILQGSTVVIPQGS